MIDEAKIIDNALFDAKLPGKVIPPPASFQTTKMRAFYLDGLQSFEPDKVIRMLQGRLEEAFTSARRQDTLVRIAKRPLRVEVARQEAQPYRPYWSVLKGLVNAAPSDVPLVLLGETYNFDTIPRKGEQRLAFPLTIDLSDPGTPHILIGAVTGGGKTRLALSILLSMAAATGPHKLGLIIIDPKGRDFIDFNVPHLLCPVVTDGKEVLKTLTRLRGEVLRRKKVFESFPSGTPMSVRDAAMGARIVVYCDELAQLSDQCPAAITMLKTLIALTRAYGIHFILATQRPTSSTIKEMGDLHANLPVRIVGQVARPEDAKPITGRPGSEVRADTLTTGDFILVGEAKMRRFHTLGLDMDEVPLITSGIHKRWAKKQLTDSLAPSPAEVEAEGQAEAAPAIKSRVAAPEREDHDDKVVQAILSTYNQNKKWPTVWGVRQWHKQAYKADMNEKIVKKLLAQAQAMTGETTPAQY